MLVQNIAQFIHNKGIGQYDPTGVKGNIFDSILPSEPHHCISIFPSGGSSSDGGLGYDNPAIQIIVRGERDPRVPRQTAQRIYDVLHGFGSGPLLKGGVWVLQCLGMQSGPIHIGQDNNHRHEYSINFTFEIRNKNEHRE